MIFFYFVLWLGLAARVCLANKPLIAIALEAPGEDCREHDYVIQRTAKWTISLELFAIPVLNSVFRIFAMLLGVFLARALARCRHGSLRVLVFEAVTMWIIAAGAGLNVLDAAVAG